MSRMDFFGGMGALGTFLVSGLLWATPPKKEAKMAIPPTSWVEARAAKAEARLQKTEAGRLVLAGIRARAEGGLRQWFSAGPLGFRFAYRPVHGKGVRDSYQVVDTWSSRAFHRWTPQPKVTFGWDGKRAWKHPKDATLTINARFWSLTPYYFVAIPFVLGDEGVNLKVEGEATLEGKAYKMVRVTFATGTGDAPDDYYIAYFDKKTHRLGALRYVVSYPGYFKKGKHSPEKIMIYDGDQSVHGIHFPKSFRTFTWDGKKPVKLVTNTALSQVGFHPKTHDALFSMPDGAKPITSWK